MIMDYHILKTSGQYITTFEGHYVLTDNPNLAGCYGSLKEAMDGITQDMIYKYPVIGAVPYQTEQDKWLNRP